MRNFLNARLLVRRWRRMILRASRKAGGRAELFTLLSRTATAFAAGCIAMLILYVPGCASTAMSPPPPSREVRASLGQVGVISVGPELSGSISGPIGVGREIGRGAFRFGSIRGPSGARTGP